MPDPIVLDLSVQQPAVPVVQVPAAPVVNTVADPAHAPAPEPQKFTQEQITSLETKSPSEIKAFIAGLSQEDKDKIIKAGGLNGLLPAAPQKTDPTPAAADPAAAPTPEPGTTPPEGTEPPAGDPPAEDGISWEMTDEELAQAPPKVRELYKSAIEMMEKAAEAPAPAEPDPLDQDPRVAWIKQVVASGATIAQDLPDVQIEDLLAPVGGSIDDLWKALDELHQKDDAQGWTKTIQGMIQRVVQETRARMAVELVPRIEAARNAGETNAKIRSSVLGFVKEQADFKSAEPLMVQKDGRDVLNPKHPSFDFIAFIRDNHEILDPIAGKLGPEKMVQQAFLLYSGEKAGGVGKMMSNFKNQAAQAAIARMKGQVSKVFSQSAAPSVGMVRAPIQGAADVMYHGVNLASLKTKADVDHAINTFRAQGNQAAVNGLPAALQKLSR